MVRLGQTVMPRTDAMPKVSVLGTLSAIRMSAVSGALAKQWPEVIKQVPEMHDCFQGTINVDLVALVLIINPERTVPPFEWEPGHIEGFGVLEIKFEWPIDTEPVRAWVYLPHHSPHRYNMLRAEVITKEIPLLRSKMRGEGTFTEKDRQCLLHFSSISGFII